MKKALVWIVVVMVLFVAACGGGETPTPEPLPQPTTTAVTVVVVTSPPEPTPEATEPPAAASGAVASLEDVKQATIQIEAQGSFVDPAGERMSMAGTGSGFIVDPSGIAVTNNHVVSGAALLRVWVGGETQPRNARILGVSECSDLAVIDLEGEGYPYLAWYEGPIKAGLDVYTAGFPLGDPEFTLTSGIVSKERASGESSWASVNAVIEHDATINPASSGGPLVTKEGKVVAVNYAGISDTNQYFAIARDEALPILERLIGNQDVDSMGVNGEAVILEGDLSGIWVSSVRSGSPADRAGVKGGDIIVQLAGLDLATDGSMADYCDILRTQGPEATLDLQVVRYATSEVWEGQINGRPMALSFSFEETGGADVGEGSATYANYTRVDDDLGSIAMEVPVEWNAVDGSPWTDDVDGSTIGASLQATTDAVLFDSYEAPGVLFLAATTAPGEFDAGGILDLIDFGADCTYDGRADYQDSLYTGLYDYFYDCGTTGSSIFSVVAAPEDQTFFALVILQALSDADLEAADHVFDTFEVVGTLP
ncbi:MAG TPA: S1C family serine protease [Anaerolineae bacterium]|nr:S1C family serine protease [Anaerolineae bacterium]